MNTTATAGVVERDTRWRNHDIAARVLFALTGVATLGLAVLGPGNGASTARVLTMAIGGLVVANLGLQVFRRRIFRWLDRRASWIVVAACFLYWLAIVPGQAVARPFAGPFEAVLFTASIGLYPLVTWGLLSLSRARPGRLAVAVFCLDQLIVSWAAGMVLWHLVLYPAGAHAGASLADMFLVTIQPAADLGILLLAIALLGVPLRGVTRRVKLLLIAALIGIFGSDLAMSLGSLASSATTDALTVLCQLWFWVAAGWITIELAAAGDTADQRGHVTDDRLSFSWLPYVAIAIAFVVPAIAGWGQLALLEQHVPASTVLIVLVMLRLALMARQNAALVSSIARRRSEARFGALVQNASDLIVLTDAASQIRYVTSSAMAMIGRSPAELEHSSFTDLVHPDERSKAIALVTEVAAAPGETRSAEWRLSRQDGSWCETEVLLSNLVDLPEVNGLVFTARDIGERKALERQLMFQALHDPLTGLANRTLFADRVEHALAGSRRRHGRVAIIYLDLDDFKRINDGHGHGTGDRLLVEVAARVRSVFRSDDTVARLGGDEFGVLLENIDSADDARRLADRVSEALTAPIQLGGIEAFVSASLGIAFSVGDDLDHEQLLRNADVAMYVAKANGKRHTETFDPRMHESVRKRLMIESDLRRAIDNEEFEVFYQPVWSTTSREMLGVEALVRWRHPSRGLLAPAEFIGIAEDTGLIVPIGSLVLRTACLQVAGWDKSGAVGTKLFVAVNLSPRQLREAGLVELVAGALTESGLSPSRLYLEITEAVLVDDSPAIATLLNRLKALGLRISIDDFGTGYSSLSYLQRLPIDTLKIAKPFVDVVTNGARDEALAQAIVSLARSLELNVVAEGVEDEAQLDTLMQMGCELGQGYLVSPPVPADRLPALASNRQGKAAA